MCLVRFVLPAIALCALSSPTARAGLVTITPESPTIALWQTDKITISVDEPGSPLLGILEELDVLLSVNGGPTTGAFSDFHLASDLPPDPFFVSDDPNTGSAEVNVSNSTGSSFSGDVYSFIFTPTAIGSYTFTVDELSVALYPSGGDPLSGSPATIIVVAAVTAPEPTSLTLLGIGVTGVVLRVWGKRRIRE